MRQLQPGAPELLTALLQSKDVINLRAAGFSRNMLTGELPVLHLTGIFPYVSKPVEELTGTLRGTDTEPQNTYFGRDCNGAELHYDRERVLVHITFYEAFSYRNLAE